jgi:hypothetical protein
MLMKLFDGSLYNDRLYLCQNGGSDAVIVTSKRGHLYRQRNRKRCFYWPAIHVRERGKDTLPEVDNI